VVTAARPGTGAAPDIGANARDRTLEVGAQIEVQSLLDQDALHAERRAAQPKRILGAGGLLADGEDACKGVELVGDRERQPYAGRWQRIARRSRQVLLAQTHRNLFGLIIRPGVVATHDALELGKLPDHRRQQIALGEIRGTQRRLPRGAGERGDVGHQDAQAACLVAE